jgi:aldehyde dehydrogenase (NAD+)
MAEGSSPVVPARPSIWIGDRRLSEGSGGVHDHINPATGRAQQQIPLAGKAEVDEAVETAAEALKTWRNWRPAERRDALLRLAALLRANAAEFGIRGAFDTGTPITVGSRSVDLAVAWTSYYAGWADKLDGAVSSTYGPSGEFHYSVPEPYGVIGIIITWNGPLISLGMKVGPALAAGNTVVVKPSEMTPFAPDLFMKLVLDAGIPPGVVNMLPGGIEAGEALVSHPKVEKVTFTGGPIAARKILTLCAQQLKPAVLELGGKSANLIFPDANLDVVCPHAAAFPIGVLSGQGCALPTRLLVHQDVYDQVVNRVLAVAPHLPFGDPFDPAMLSGPVVNKAAYDRILALIARARDEKMGKLVLGGGRLERMAEGYFIEPTVFIDVDPQSELAQHEVFGPVLSIMAFKDEDEAVAIANDTEYGLSAYIQTKDVQRVHRLAERLRAGSIHVNGASTIPPNAPFGGVGLSGYGREGGRQGIDEFLRPKMVGIGVNS